MSFGLKCALATFMDLIKKVFKKYLDLFVIVFIIISSFAQGMRKSMQLIYSRNEEELPD